jgi:hypothetical protein
MTGFKDFRRKQIETDESKWNHAGQLRASSGGGDLNECELR